MFLMTRTYLFESFDNLSDRIKFDQIWRAGLTLVASVLPWHFEPSVLTPRSKEAPATTGDDCSEMCHFDFKGHMCQCALQRCDNSPVLEWGPSWTCICDDLNMLAAAFYTYIYIYNYIYTYIYYIYIYYPKIVSWCACGHLTPILITIYMEWYESNLFKCSDILVQILVHIESQNCDKSHLSILPNSTHHDPRLPVAGHQAPP